MKFLIFCVAVMAAMPVCAESERLPVKARIINLATMPTHQALEFCNDRDLECPAIRDKAKKEKENQEEISYSLKTANVVIRF